MNDKYIPYFKEPMQIVYHGTNKTAAFKILKNGFKEGTYFAVHLEDAIGYGGLYVFEVVFPSSLIQKGQWQICTFNPLQPESIVRMTKFNKSDSIIDNNLLRIRISISNQSNGEIKYIRKDMINNPNSYNLDEHKAYQIVDLKEGE